jgi:NADH dehydrogenase
VDLGSRFAVNEVMGVRFSGLIAALFWRAVYLSKLESPQNRARVAADWILGFSFAPRPPRYEILFRRLPAPLGIPGA